MDNVQKLNNCINISSSQTFEFTQYLKLKDLHQVILEKRNPFSPDKTSFWPCCLLELPSL
jgi:hypothetical protein